jgi:hypothetical protein
MSAWQRLDRELDAWRASGRRATLWCRDDDASRDSPALQQLLGMAAAMQVPIALAAIPAELEASLVDAVAASDKATVIQHGYAHRNHAPPGARKSELGAHRAVTAIVDDLRHGRAVLARGFGERFAAVLVPPWNRIAPEIVQHLPDAGFRGLSTFGPRAAVSPVPGLTQCNTHVDLIAWRTGRVFVGVDHAIGRLVEHLAARREGRADASEPSGILTHHLDLDDAGWRFLIDLMARTREHEAVDWLDARVVFGVGGGAPRVTSGRSA